MSRITLQLRNLKELLFKKTKLLTFSIGGAALLCSLGYGTWYAWNNGYIPGNKRAATAEMMQPSVLRAVLQKKQQQSTVCVGPELDHPQPETQGLLGITNRPFPGQHAITLLIETNVRAQEIRERQIRQLSFFSKQGFFTESDISVETDGGMRPAKQYRLTWKGYGELLVHSGNIPCFMIGHREFEGIKQIEKRSEEFFGLDTYEVSYETVIKDVPMWATNTDAKRLFPKLTSLIETKRETMSLLRTKEGWITEMESQIQVSAMHRDGRGAEYLKQLMGQTEAPIAIDTPKIQAIFNDYLNSTQWLGHGSVACLPLRLQRGGDDREAAIDRNNFSVTYYDQATRPDYQRTQMVNALHILAALEGAELAKRESPPPPNVSALTSRVLLDSPVPFTKSVQSPTSQTKVNGVRFILSPEAIQALEMNSGSNCIPIGRLKVDLLNTQITNFHAVQILAHGKISQTPDWVLKIAERLPALRSAIEEGVPLTGTLQYAEDYQNRQNGIDQTKRWFISGLNPTYPEVMASSVPAELEAIFPETTKAMSKVVKSNTTGLPLIAGSVIAPPPAPPPIPGANTPTPKLQGQQVVGETEKPPVIQGVAAPFPAGDFEVHAISIYEGNLPGGVDRGFQQHPEGIVEIKLGKTNNPTMLLLSSYEPINWHISLEQGAKLAKIVAFGYYPQHLTINGKHNAEIITPTRGMLSKVGGDISRLPTTIEVNRMRDVADIVRNLTGKIPTSFQAEYRPKQPFSVNTATTAFAIPALKSVSGAGISDVILQGSDTTVTTLGVKYNNSGAYTDAWASRAYSAGKVYFEGYMKVQGALVSQPHANVGIALSGGGRSRDGISEQFPVIDDGSQKLYKNGDVFGLALDLDGGIMYVRINGEWITGEPSSGNGRAFKKGREYVPYFFASGISDGNKHIGDTSWTANFGASAFKYPIPKGYASYDGRQKK